jgi:hypothetical protein
MNRTSESSVKVDQEGSPLGSAAIVASQAAQAIVIVDAGAATGPPDWDASWDDVRSYKDVMTEKESERDARVLEFSRLVAGYALQDDDMEVIPPSATSQAVISIAGRSAPAKYLYGMLEEKAMCFGITPEEFLELGVRAESWSAN